MNAKIPAVILALGLAAASPALAATAPVDAIHAYRGTATGPWKAKVTFVVANKYNEDQAIRRISNAAEKEGLRATATKKQGLFAATTQVEIRPAGDATPTKWLHTSGVEQAEVDPKRKSILDALRTE